MDVTVALQFDDYSGLKAVERRECPHCKSHDIRRSRRVGLWEGFFVRIILRAPYRCNACKSRFWSCSWDPLSRKRKRHHSIAAFFGLRGIQKKKVKRSVCFVVIACILIIAGIYFAPVIDKYISPESSQPEPPPSEHSSEE